MCNTGRFYVAFEYIAYIVIHTGKMQDFCLATEFPSAYHIASGVMATTSAARSRGLHCTSNPVLRREVDFSCLVQMDVLRVCDTPVRVFGCFHQLL